MREIQLDVKIEGKEIKRIYLQRSFRQRWMFWCSLPLISIVLAVIIFSGGKIQSPLAYLAPFFPLLAGALFVIVIWRTERENALTDLNIRYIFSEKDVRTVIESKEQTAEWSNFLALTETKDDFILADDAKGVYHLPKKFFVPAQIVEFKALCQDKLGAKAKFI
jgi:hypothetical protein